MNTPILFLHGFPFNGSLWKPQLEFFKEKRIVLAPDLRGHGSGPKEDKPWMLLDYVDDLHELLMKAKIDRVVLCGHSMGGYIALEFIQKYPDMVSSLVLVGTRPDADSNEVKKQRFKLLERIRKEGLNGFAEDFSKMVLSDVKNVELKRGIQDMILQNAPEDIMAVIGALASRRDSSPLLKEISCPTMVIVGADDNVTSWGVNYSMARKITDCQFVKIPKAGHVVGLEQSEKFNALLDTFINYHNLDIKELTNGYPNRSFAIQH